MKKIRVGVLVSGRGSNLEAILNASRKKAFSAEVVLVISNIPNAAALLRAKKAGVQTSVVEHQKFSNREAFELEIVRQLQKAKVDLVCLAGFMRMISPVLIQAYPSRILNIHPALLPSFPGLHAQRQALEHGVKVTGVTVHFVDEETDTGPIILQKAVPVLDHDTEETLSRRILKWEHRLYPEAIQLVAEGKVKIRGRRVYKSR